MIGEFDDDWENNTDYVIGDKIRDATDGSLWIWTGNHTSSYDGTFAEDRAGLGNIPLLDEFGDPILDEFNQPILVERICTLLIDFSNLVNYLFSFFITEF